MRVETWACDAHVQAGPHASVCPQQCLPASTFRRTVRRHLPKKTKKRKSEIFCLLFLGHSKFSLMVVEGKHQTEKSLLLINCCVWMIRSLVIQLNCLQGLGLNAKGLTRLSWLSFGREQLQRGAGGWFSPCCESSRGIPASILSPSASSAPCAGWEVPPLLLSPLQHTWLHPG